MKPSAPITLWAIEIRSARSWWINYATIKRTRKQAIAAYKANFSYPALGEEVWSKSYAAGDIRPVRVTVEVARP